MADQEFLASYGVDIDEEGVKRLETILKENEKMGKAVSSAFNSANTSIEEYLKNQPKVNKEPTEYEKLKIQAREESAAKTGEGTDYEALKKQARENNTFDPAESVRGLAQTLLTGLMAEWKDPDDPTRTQNARDWALQNMETMSVGAATKDSANARKELVSWQDYGLSSNPAELPGYEELQQKAQELLREPIEKAREYMQQAMDAESQGLDGTEYVDKITELLEEPFQKVRELYDNFDFGDLGEGSTGDGTGGVIDELDKAKEGITELRSDAQTPVNIKGNASQVVSAARTAIESVRSLFSETFILNVRANTKTTDKDKEDEKDNNRSALRRSVGGRFSHPTYVEVAEDGDEEYIIPIRKENRAMPLIRQMLGELSPDARQSLVEKDELTKENHEVLRENNNFIREMPAKESLDVRGNDFSAGLKSLGKELQNVIGNAGSVGIGSAAREVSGSETNNVSAPVTINVNASGSDAKQIGQSVYNAAERYLLRTMKGALA